MIGFVETSGSPDSEDNGKGLPNILAHSFVVSFQVLSLVRFDSGLSDIIVSGSHLR